MQGGSLVVGVRATRRPCPSRRGLKLLYSCNGPQALRLRSDSSRLNISTVVKCACVPAAVSGVPS
eukprot:COSAG01_NODE_143_length_24153_cov_54.226116_16_plen_65_part_00